MRSLQARWLGGQVVVCLRRETDAVGRRGTNLVVAGLARCPVTAGYVIEKACLLDLDAAGRPSETGRLAITLVRHRCGRRSERTVYARYDGDNVMLSPRRTGTTRSRFATRFGCLVR